MSNDPRSTATGEDVENCPFDDWGDYPEPVAAPVENAKASARPRAKDESPSACLVARAPKSGSGKRPAQGPPMPTPNRLGFFPAWAHRSALFGCGKTGSLRLDPAVAMAGQGAMCLQGPALSMTDKDIWEVAIDLARLSGNGLGEPFEAPLRRFVQRMGKSSTGGAALGRVKGSLERLESSRLAIELPFGRASGSMIASVEVVGSVARIALDPSLMSFALGAGQQFHIDSSRRRTLPSALARWLHDFVSTHTKPHDHDFDYLAGLSGFQGRSRDFPAALRSACGELAGLGAPLMLSHRVDATTRKSGAWTLSYVRGAEKPKYFEATRFAAQKPKGLKL